MEPLDTNNPYNNSISEKQFNGFFVPNHNAKVIKDAIENGTAPFLPDEHGNVNARPIYNGNTGFCLNAKDLIPLQIVQGDSSNMVVTYKTAQNAGTRIREGEKGFFFNFKRQDKTIGTSQYFFPEQTENPELIREVVAEKMLEVYKAGIPKLDKVMEVTSADPAEYLASYVAACKSGASLKVEPGIAEEFKQNFVPLLKNQTARGNKNPEIETLGQFMFNVDQKANAINKELFADIRRENQQEEFRPKQNDRKPVELER